MATLYTQERSVGSVVPTQCRVIAGMAWAAKDNGDALPESIRLSPATWALLAMDFYATPCPCPNCRRPGPMYIAGVPVVIDSRVGDGAIEYAYGLTSASERDYSYMGNIL